jgi:lipopolysaccharide/colanic/teichoic acid biosynthesis glycosyltransferase
MFTFPITFCALFIIFLHDFKSPVYVQKRVGLNGYYFNLYKVRTMRLNSNSPNFLATSINDKRLFLFGKIFRKYKIDEFPQFFNVFLGNINLVGPRPNIIPLLQNYSAEEFALLKIKPGLTDIASIMLSDLNELLSCSKNPDLEYELKYRKLKNNYSLFYLKEKSFNLDLIILISTFVVLFNKKFGKITLKFFYNVQ